MNFLNLAIFLVLALMTLGVFFVPQEIRIIAGLLNLICVVGAVCIVNEINFDRPEE